MNNKQNTKTGTRKDGVFINKYSVTYIYIYIYVYMIGIKGRGRQRERTHNRDTKGERASLVELVQSQIAWTDGDLGRRVGTKETHEDVWEHKETHGDTMRRKRRVEMHGEARRHPDIWKHM